MQQQGATAEGKCGWASHVTCSRLIDQIERLAHHAHRGEVWDKVLTSCRQAGTKAFARSANLDAVSYFEQALTAFQHLPERREMLEQAIDIRFDIRPRSFRLADMTEFLATFVKRKP